MFKPQSICLVAVLSSFVGSAVAQTGGGGVEMDAYGFRFDSTKALVELHYGIVQRVLPFIAKGEERTAHLRAKAEIWNGSTLLAEQSIDKSITIKGSQQEFEAASARKLLDGVAFQIPYTSAVTARLVWIYPGLDGKDRRDTVSIPVAIPSQDRGRFGLSGVELASEVRKADGSKNPFEKVGYVVTPNPSSVYGDQYTKLYYYSEIYVPERLVDEAKSVEVVTRVLDNSGHELLTNTMKQSLFGPVVPYIGSISVDGLPSDKYKLEISVKHQGAIEAQTEKTFFFDDGMKIVEEEVVTPIADDNAMMQTLGVYQLSLQELEERWQQSAYLANKDEQKGFEKMKDEAAKRRYYYDFWKKKSAERGVALATTYSEYFKRVERANKEFTNMKTPGWKTHRGRVALIYGWPDPTNIQQQLFSSESKPYILWEYPNNSSIHLMNGVRPAFVFLDRTGGGRYELVHSNVQGEMYNPEWYNNEARRLR